MSESNANEHPHPVPEGDRGLEGTRDHPAGAAAPEVTEAEPTRAEASATDTVESYITGRLSETLGGWHGSIETALPTVAFVVWWQVSQNLPGALMAAGAVALVLLVIRLITGGTLRFVLASLFVTAIGAALALNTGDAKDAFLPGILASCGWLIATVASVVLRWPLLGFMVAALDAADDPKAFTRWRQDPGMVRVCSRLTLVLASLYAVRVVIMLPMYLADNIAGLGVAKIVLGWPAYLLAVVVMAVILTRGRTRHTSEA